MVPIKTAEKHTKSKTNQQLTVRTADKCMYIAVAAWRSGNIIGRINKVTLRRARLVLGSVTVMGG